MQQFTMSLKIGSDPEFSLNWNKILNKYQVHQRVAWIGVVSSKKFSEKHYLMWVRYDSFAFEQNKGENTISKKEWQLIMY